MPGLENDVLVAKNVNFDYTATPPHAGIITADGELLIGASTEPFLRAGTLTSTGGSVTITPGPGTINIEAVGTGDVSGPAFSTDNAVARWNGVTGNFIQNSVVIIDDTGITTGATWNGNTITVPYGGTGAASLTGVLTGNGVGAFTASTVTQYNVLVGGASNSVSSVGPGSAGQVLQSGGNAANPFYSTATFPSTATGTGTILRADGTNWVATTATYPATTTINQILYSSANNVIGGITAGIDGVLISSHTGVPSWLANGIAGQVLTANTNLPPSWQSAVLTNDYRQDFLLGGM